MALLPSSVSVERVIAAPAERIFDLLADPARHSDIDGSGTVRAPTSGAARLSLGGRFGMGMRAGLGYEMVNEVVEFEEGRRIAWQARPTYRLARPFIGGRIWRYELEPVEGGTLVRETWDVSQEQVKPLVLPLAGAVRTSMQRTLERIEELVGE